MRLLDHDWRQNDAEESQNSQSEADREPDGGIKPRFFQNDGKAGLSVDGRLWTH